ncbi:nitroreductase family protein [Enterococcus wangshanyuanii]|uniref:Nitroreductase n=1 Tax=Enterococcus wangshanyuanii TaxID=2005703 RepID=A0ABQ1P326_9ENTE|nr:nitroreductase family protein [Enterococcus wangshanyuanii]GGC89376.1 nitroreductase [Enterococcus wangshanyuanii]
MVSESIEQIIKERRTVRAVSDQSVSIEDIQALLEVASYAPFHSKEEPWSVVIVAGQDERRLFVEKIMDSYERLNIWARYDQQHLAASKKRTEEYYLSVPVTLIVTAPVHEKRKANLEAISAVSAFIQNFQLAAWSRNVGVTWRTVPIIFDDVFKQELGIGSDRQIIGLLDISMIDEIVKLPTAKRKAVEQWAVRLSEKLSENKE